MLTTDLKQPENNLDAETTLETYPENYTTRSVPEPTNRVATSFQDVLKDKRFWMTIPVLLIALVSTGYFLIAGTTDPTKALVNNVNATIPNAQTDSVPKSKLELQAAEQRRGINQPLTVNGLQTGISARQPETQSTGSGLPATLEPYLYKRKRQPEAIDPELAALDSLYNPSRPIRSRSVAQSRASKPYRLASTTYTQSPEEINWEEGRSGNAQKQTDDRQRLLALLTEYKRDKEARALAVRDEERPHKVEPGSIASSVGGTVNRQLNGFYGLFSSDQKQQQEAALTQDLGTIRAVIYQDQQITDGGRVQLRLLEPMTVRGIHIPANTLLYGTGSFGTERVSISISQLQYEGKLFPIKLTVHDMDGMPGVYVPNVLAAQEGKQMLGQTIGGANYNLSSTTASNTRAAMTMAGISAAQSGLAGARNLLQRKITQQKATLKGNYYVLLK